MQPLGQTSQALVDSVFAATRQGPRVLTVVYAFDNPCGDSVDGFTRTAGPVIEVRFDVRARAMRDPRIGEPRACPAALVFQAYAVHVDVSQNVLVMRGFVGNAQNSRIVRELQMPSR